MRMTVRQYKRMGRSEFMDAALAELEEKARRPGLSPAEREAAENAARRAREQLAERAAPPASAARAA